MDLAELLFSSTGRLGRVTFVVTGAIVLGLTWLFCHFAPPAIGFPLGFVVYPLAFVIGCCLISKRLHDRSRSGWWAGVVMLAIIVVWPIPSTVVDYVFTAILIWAMVELGLMPGAAGANRFGAPPVPTVKP